MKLRFSKIDTLIIGICALLLVILIAFAQFYKLSPLKADLKTKQQTLQSNQKLLEMTSQKKTVTASKTVEDTRELQKKVPVKPLQDQFILDLEKAETVSNSQIKSMGFSKDADVTAGTNQASTQTTNGQQTTAANQNAATQDKTKQATTTPTGLKKLTVNLSVNSPSYEEFERFIQTLESLKRIVVVESITYSGGQEVTSLTADKQPLSYSLTVSAFYLPTLADLQAELPKLDTPAPGGKENPLSQFSDPTQP